jgi:hypothetical protein
LAVHGFMDNSNRFDELRVFLFVKKKWILVLDL